MNQESNKYNSLQDCEETLVSENDSEYTQTVESTLVNDPDKSKTVHSNKVPSQEEVQVNPSKGKKNGHWKKVVFGGVTGIALGSAGAFAKSAASEWIHNEEDNETPVIEEEEEVITNNDEQSIHEEPSQPISTEPLVVESQTTVSGFSVATCVHDNMTFGEAFAAARAEIGPGGIFEFEGELYSTYYENEWDSMSSSEKYDYNSRLNAYLRGELPAEQPTITSTESTTGDMGSTGLEVQAVFVDPESGYTVIQGDLDEHHTLLVDDPNTEGIDYMGVDIDDSGNFVEGEIYDISASGLSIEDVLGGTEFEGFDPNEPIISFE